VEDRPKESILIVEDDDSWLELCGTLLRAEGFEVRTAQNKHQALKAVDARDFDLVLTDLCLPAEEDGRGVVSGVKARRPGTDVILMTASPTLQTAISVLKDGAYDYIIKPFQADYLKAVIDRCLAARRSKAELSVERQLREEVQAAYSELKKLEKLKEAFLSRISHELNTPLAEALMAMSLLEATLPEGAKTWDKARMADAAVKKLQSIVRDLLDFVDLQHDDFQLEREELSLAGLIEETAKEEAPLLEKRGVTLSVSIPADLPPVSGDPRLLKRAFRQLLLNAIHFNKPGGRVEVAAKAWEQWVFLHFLDEGEGVPEGKKDEIFDSFYQMADYMTRRVGGLGLGLAITRKILEAHKGSISVEARKEQGSDFKVCLPRA